MANIPEHLTREQLNQRDVEFLYYSAETARKQLIDSAYRAVCSAWADDQVQLDRISNGEAAIGEVLDFYVGFELGVTPYDGGEPEHSLSIRLEPDRDLGQTDDKVLMVYVPVPDDFGAGDNIEPPDGVYFAVYDESSTQPLVPTPREAVEKDKYFTYVEASDSEQVDTYSIDSPEDFYNLFTKRITTNMAEIYKLFENLVNKKTVPQTSHLVNGRVETSD